MAYVLQVETLERRTAVMIGVATSLLAAGGEADIPSFEDERAKFDEALNAEPKPLSRSGSLLRMLGVA